MSLSSVFRTCGLDEPVNGVTPYWTGVEECDVCEGDVSLSRTGSDEPVNSVVRTSGPGGPGNETVADDLGDVIVMSSECQEIDKGTKLHILWVFAFFCTLRN